MEITKIENPSWCGDIKEILLPYSSSFDFKGITENYPLGYYEWWVIKDADGVALGVGWLDFDENSFGQKEGEISLCVNIKNHSENVGSTLLSFLEDEIKRRGVSLTSAVVKKSNPHYQHVVNWFVKKNYIVDSDGEKTTYLIKKGD
ncbi:hypothetical protein [Mesobacillus jeotgali]|uniref:hypothetical protein n=1 Tax=Mesobacillus jeotgali TaxID=129985 RepID=UPI0009A81A07|nr:hypothetical protein [Mesobacillus jeotgali]